MVVQDSQKFLGEWLKGMSLEMKPSKTKITHTLTSYEEQVGFDFLGHNIRQYPVGKTHSKQGFKTIIKPSKEAQVRHSRRIQAVVQSHKAASQVVLIDRLNPIIRGWANYYSNACSKATYCLMDHQVYLKLRAWARRRHPNKNQHWIAHKYWLIGSGQGWVFSPDDNPYSMRLFKHSQTTIKRHVKVQNRRSPYDGDWVYWSLRIGHYPAIPNSERFCAISAISRNIKNHIPQLL